MEAGSARAAASSAGGAFLGCRVRRAKRALMCSQIWHVALDPRTDAQVEFGVHPQNPIVSRTRYFHAGGSSLMRLPSRYSNETGGGEAGVA